MNFSAVVSLLAFLLSFGVKQTQLDMNIKASEELKKSDDEMSKLYLKIAEDYRNDSEFVDKFKKAQAAWLAYRDAHLDAVYPHKDKQASYGSVFPMCSCILIDQLTRDRIRELKQWADGTEEGNVCAGSIKFKDRKK